MNLFRALQSRLQYKIILPFLLLTLLVALVGSSVAFLFIVGNAQERLNNQLAQVGRVASDRVVEREDANLVFLREVAFAGENTQAGAPAVADALAGGDVAGLERALDPYFRISADRGIPIDRLIAFDQSGRTLVDWERSGETERVANTSTDIRGLWFVPQILAGAQDNQGDKYAGLLELGGSDRYYLFSVAPVTRGNQIVGGLVAAIRTDGLLRELSSSSQAAIITIYEPDSGRAAASTGNPASGLASLDVRPELLDRVRTLPADHESIFDIVRVNQREYQIAYAPLRVRGDTVALMSVGLATDYVSGPLADARTPMLGLTVVLMLAIIGLGVFVARQITRPLEELVATAQAVTAGDLDRRSKVQAIDEVGVLADSFNTMTAHLLDLYRAVQSESSQRAAIVESITEGVIVCDPDDNLLLMNRAARGLLGIEPSQPAPARFADIQLAPVRDAALTIDGTPAQDLFELRDRIVRLGRALFQADDGTSLGHVYVLQDRTAEVATDRAKTDFIATISHELRTPLTILGGNADLLLRNLAGTLSDEQRPLIEVIRAQTQHMTGLVNNVITIAGLESGTLGFDPEPLRFCEVLNRMLWPIQKSMSTRGLALTLDVPDETPTIYADEHQLRIILQQLLDNAQRYTSVGGVTVRATTEEQRVRIDICDTGCGIDQALHERLFTRFSRQAESNNTSERGIGLGLAIARALVERQGGRIWLEASSEAGTTFSFTLLRADVDPHMDNRNLAPAA
jgi:signal transduction histidine kinase